MTTSLREEAPRASPSLVTLCATYRSSAKGRWDYIST